MSKYYCALSLPKQNNGGEALLFSCLLLLGKADGGNSDDSSPLQPMMRSLLVKAPFDLVDRVFVGLGAVYFQSPTKITPSQLLGILLSSPRSKHSFCASVLPLDILEDLCSAALSYENLLVYTCHLN